MLKSPPQFTFAVIADTHVIIEREADTSPYPVNALATKRTKWVIEDIKRRNPDFVIHVGDMVRPFPSLPSFEEACELARQTFSDLKCPIHFLPGNHDIGDKPYASAPAPTITQEFLEMYEDQFGDHFASFDNGDCHFVLLNASIINSQLPGEAIQSKWLKEDLKAALGKRIFVFIHYPPFLAVPDEFSNYDNIDEPGRSWLLEIMAQHNAEALFAGHVHHFFYNSYKGADFYYLPSTSFARHDFSELFHMEPAAEYGRNDPGKLGYAMVEVYENEHIVRLIGSDGQVAGESEDIVQSEHLPVHPRENLNAPIGVQLRHAWNEIRALPYNNPLDEFSRKLARNDYPLLATWQIGLTYLRVPIDDILDSNTRDRMKALQGMGQRFVVMHFGLPDTKMLKLFSKHRELIHAIEIILPHKWLGRAANELRTLKSHFDGSIYLAVLDSSSEGVDGTSRHFGHSTKFGFHMVNGQTLAKFQRENAALIDIVDGLSFHISVDDDIWEHLANIENASCELGKSALVHVNDFNKSSAVAQFDDHLIANRSALACVGAFALSNGTIILDTLMDIDRAHYPRHGLIDRRGNFRLSAQYLQNLLPHLSRSAGSMETELGKITNHGDWIAAEFLQDGSSSLLLLCRTPNPDSGWDTILAKYPDYGNGTCLVNATQVSDDKSASESTGLLFHLM